MGALGDAVSDGMDAQQRRSVEQAARERLARDEIARLAREFADIAIANEFPTVPVYDIPGQRKCWSVYLAVAQDFYDQVHLIVFPDGGWSWASRVRKTRLFGKDAVGWTRGHEVDVMVWNEPAYFVTQFRDSVMAYMNGQVP